MNTELEKEMAPAAQEKGVYNKGESIHYVGGEEIFNALEAGGYLAYLVKRGRFIRYRKGALDQALARLELAGGIS